MSLSQYDSLDLDINNYELKDIEKFFQLDPRVIYTPSEIEYKETLVREKLLKSGHINKKFKSDLIEFLKNARNFIIDKKCPPLPPPTSIPPNFRLDPTPNIPFIPPSHARTQELIFNPPIIPIHTTNGNNYYSGKLNPIECRTKTINVCIDTLFRKNYGTTKSTDFIYIFPKNIQNVVSLKLTSLEFPFSPLPFFISSSQNNNSMNFQLFNMKNFADSSFNITIPDGNYTPSTFSTTVNNIFDFIGNGMNFLICETDVITQKTVIRVRDSQIDQSTGGHFPYHNGSDYSPNFYFKVIFDVQQTSLCQPELQPLCRNLGWLLGFRNTSYTVHSTDVHRSFYYGGETVLFNGYLQSETASSLTNSQTQNNYFFVEIDDFQNNFPTDSVISTNCSQGNYIGKNIIAKIILRPGATFVDDNGSDLIFKKRDYFGPVHLEKFKIRILNRFGEIIDIQQNDFSMTLEMTILNTESGFS